MKAGKPVTTSTAPPVRSKNSLRVMFVSAKRFISELAILSLSIPRYAYDQCSRDSQKVSKRKLGKLEIDI